jgi:uncharacterized protein
LIEPKSSRRGLKRALEKMGLPCNLEEERRNCKDMAMERLHLLQQIRFQFKIHSVCGLLCPRQVGKTTLARRFIHGLHDVTYFDLENPVDIARLENPMLALSDLQGSLIVIDEIQRNPNLFPVLRVLVDEKPKKILILGSASRDLVQHSSETLAGRIGLIELTPFSVAETKEQKKLFLRGGFPNSYLANSDTESFAWRQEYISTFIERDIPNLGFFIPAAQMRRLWMMLAHNHGDILNATEIGRSLGFTYQTIRKYIDILAGTFIP